MSVNKKIVGFWDLNKAKTGLGSLLIFQEELLQCKELINAYKIDLVFCYDEISTKKVFLATVSKLNPYLGALYFIEDCRQYKKERNDFVWPNSENISHTSYAESYLAVQDFWRKTGKLFNLKSPNKIKKTAEAWLIKYVGNNLPISVHLKNNPNERQSNANQEAWFGFMRYCDESNLPIRFVLIGNDKINSKICALPNVVVTKNYGCDLELDLALIELSSAFMGMSSGPCNMAILSDKPYLIWKHPGHHKEEMEREFQGHKQFVFASEHQKFMQDWDTPKNIQREFSNLFRQLKPDFYS